MLLALASLLSGAASPPPWPVNLNWLVAAPARGLFLAAPSRNLAPTAPARNFLRGAPMPFAGDSQPIAPTEKRVLQINFGPQLLTGDAIASILSVTIAAYEGVDADAFALVSGSPSFSGAVVSQAAGPNWVAGVVYRVTAQVQTALGETPVVWFHIACAAVT